jgi:hypothetical protein
MENDTVIEAVRMSPAILDLEAVGLGIHALTVEARRRAIDALRLKYLPRSYEPSAQS